MSDLAKRLNLVEDRVQSFDRRLDDLNPTVLHLTAAVTRMQALMNLMVDRGLIPSELVEEMESKVIRDVLEVHRNG